MALPTTTTNAPLTEDAFLADRQKFWGSFTGVTMGAVIVMVLLLLGMLMFLV